MFQELRHNIAKEAYPRVAAITGLARRDGHWRLIAWKRVRVAEFICDASEPDVRRPPGASTTQTKHGVLMGVTKALPRQSGSGVPRRIKSRAARWAVVVVDERGKGGATELADSGALRRFKKKLSARGPKAIVNATPDLAGGPGYLCPN